MTNTARAALIQLGANRFQPWRCSESSICVTSRPVQCWSCELAVVALSVHTTCIHQWCASVRTHQNAERCHIIADELRACCHCTGEMRRTNLNGSPTAILREGPAEAYHEQHDHMPLNGFDPCGVS